HKAADSWIRWKRIHRWQSVRHSQIDYQRGSRVKVTAVEDEHRLKALPNGRDERSVQLVNVLNNKRRELNTPGSRRGLRFRPFSRVHSTTTAAKRTHAHQVWHRLP